MNNEMIPFILALVSIIGSMVTVSYSSYQSRKAWKESRVEKYREILYQRKFEAYINIYRAFYNLICFACDKNGLHNTDGSYIRETALEFHKAVSDIRTEIYKNLLFMSPQSLEVVFEHLGLLQETDYRAITGVEFKKFFYNRFDAVMAQFRRDLGFETLTDKIVDEVFKDLGKIRG